MAKAQKSFNDKMNKKSGPETKMVRLIRSVKRVETGGVAFFDNMVEVPVDGAVESHIQKIIKGGS